VDEHGAGRKKAMLTMSNLEFLAQLRKELHRLADERADARTFQEAEPSKLTIEQFAERMGVVTSTIANVIKKIEAPLGTYLVPRIDGNAPKVKRRRLRSNYPEETREFAANQDPEKRTDRSSIHPELTLDGEIWSLYADLVLRLYALTQRATAPYPPPPEPPSPTGPIQVRRGFGRPVAVARPHRPSETSRARYLQWLRHQHDLVTQGEEFIRTNRYATVFHLERLLPGYVPAPDDEPLWDPDDMDPQASSHDRTWNEDD
jgi:hypothetical protein